MQKFINVDPMDPAVITDIPPPPPFSSTTLTTFPPASSSLPHNLSRESFTAEGDIRLNPVDFGKRGDGGYSAPPESDAFGSSTISPMAQAVAAPATTSSSRQLRVKNMKEPKSMKTNI